MVERADRFENGYVEVRGWCENVYDILVVGDCSQRGGSQYSVV